MPSVDAEVVAEAEAALAARDSAAGDSGTFGSIEFTPVAAPPIRGSEHYDSVPPISRVPFGGIAGTPAAASPPVDNDPVHFEGGTDLRTRSDYHGRLRGNDAFKLLVGKPVGSYLLRVSSAPGTYAVSWVKSKSSIVHTVCTPMQGGWRMDGEPNSVYSSIAECIDKHPKSFLHPVSPQGGSRLAPTATSSRSCAACGATHPRTNPKFCLECGAKQ